MKRILLSLLMVGSAIGLFAQDISGVWKGTLNFYGSTLDVYYILSMSGDTLTAKLTVPAQGIKDFPMNEASFDGITLKLSEKRLGSSFKGVLALNAFLGNFMQNGMEIPVSLVRGEVPVPERPQTPQPPFPYREEEVVFHNPQANIDLSGTLTIPEGNGPFKAVVLVSGSGYQDRNEEVMGHKSFWVIADYLTKNGIAVLRYDDRGVGKSGGSKRNNTTEILSYDAQAAIEYLCSRKDISSVGVAGHSEGGTIAFMLAAREPKVKFVVSIAGTGVSGAEVLLEQKKAIAKAKSVSEAQINRMLEIEGKIYDMVLNSETNDSTLHKEIEKYLTGISMPESQIKPTVRSIADPWLYYFIKYSPQEAISQIKVPILAINGTNDMQVIASQNLPKIEEAAIKGGNKNVTVKYMQGLNHLFQHSETGSPEEYVNIEETFSPEALEIIARFCKGN